MRAYARNIGTQASNETIRNDMLNNDSSTLDTDTVLSYISALKKIFVIEENYSRIGRFLVGIFPEQRMLIFICYFERIAV